MRIIKLENKYYCVMKHSCTIDSVKESYMNQAKVIKNSFAGIYTERIFRNVFYNAIDLRVDYKDFYFEEYSSFQTFLYQKELFSKQEIRDLNINEDETLIKINIQTNDYNTSYLFEYEDDFIDQFNQMLEGIDK